MSRYPPTQQVQYSNVSHSNQPQGLDTNRQTAQGGPATNPFAVQQRPQTAVTQQDPFALSAVNQRQSQNNQAGKPLQHTPVQEQSVTQVSQQIGGMNLPQGIQQVTQQLFEGEPMDDYNSDKSLLRMTTDRIPSNAQLAKDCGIPLAIFVKPYGELPSGEEIPASSFNSKPIIRCKDCRAYINPFVKFTENGQKWTCNFCKDVNNTEQYYYAPTDQNGHRNDLDSRPELVYGTVDFIATMEYMNRPPMPPTFVFLFDVSQPALDSGYLAQATFTIKGLIEEGALPGGDRTKVCFLAYDKQLYFFNLRPTLKQPQMLIISDTNEVFLPQPDDLLANLSESYDLAISLLDSFSNYFTNSKAPKTQESQFVSAIQAANNISKHIGGKLLLFQVSHTALRNQFLLPKIENPTDVSQKFGATNNYFANTASELAHAQISVDQFIFTQGKGQFKNLKTFSELANKSSGSLFFYPEFNVYTQGMKFTNELYNCLTRKNAWEGVFRIRTSAGFNQVSTLGNFLIKNKTTDLMLCPALDKDRVYIYELERASEASFPIEKRRVLLDQTHIFIQSALLYSTAEGERRIRVHNACYPLTNIKHLPFEYIDASAVVSFWARQAIYKLVLSQFNFGAALSGVERQLKILCEAFFRFADGKGQNEPGKLSDLLQYLVLYTYGMIKTPIITPITQSPAGSPYLDYVANYHCMVNVMSPEEIIPMFHAQIYNVSDENFSDAQFPAMESLVRTSLLSRKIYLCYNAQCVYLLVGRSADAGLLVQLFEVNQVNQIDLNKGEDIIFAQERLQESGYLTNLYSFINQVRYQRGPFCELRVLIEGDQTSESIIQQMCVMDQRGSAYPKDYSKFLAEVEKPSRQNPGQVYY